MDAEGRIITLEFPDFFVTTVYTPNAQEGLTRLDLRGIWDDNYRNYLTSLDAQKPVFACGDFNAAYTEIDLANPRGNHNSAGFTDQEREKFGQLLEAGFTDTFRQLHGQVEKFYEEGRSTVSYTHLDVYKRQHSTKSKTMKAICKRQNFLIFFDEMS